MLISFHGAYAGKENTDMHIWRTINRLKTMISAKPEDSTQNRSCPRTVSIVTCSESRTKQAVFDFFLRPGSWYRFEVVATQHIFNQTRVSIGVVWDQCDEFARRHRLIGREDCYINKPGQRALTYFSLGVPTVLYSKYSASKVRWSPS